MTVSALTGWLQSRSNVEAVVADEEQEGRERDGRELAAPSTRPPAWLWLRYVDSPTGSPGVPGVGASPHRVGHPRQSTQLRDAVSAVAEVQGEEAFSQVGDCCCCLLLFAAVCCYLLLFSAVFGCFRLFSAVVADAVFFPACSTCNAAFVGLFVGSCFPTAPFTLTTKSCLLV
jgi:hypothetical protein